MFIKEFASSLTYMGILSRSEKGNLGDLSRKFGTTYISKFRKGSEGVFRLVNIPIDPEMNEEEQKALNSIGEYDGNGWYVLDNDLDENTSQFFTKLVDIPSVVIDAILTVDGIEHIIFRMHRSDLLRFRNLIYKEDGNSQSLFLESFEKNPGLIEIMSNVNEEVPVTYLEYQMKIPPKEMELEKDPVVSTFGNNWIREVKYLEEKSAHAIYYEKSKVLRPSPLLQEISSSDNVFLMTYSNPVINRLVSRATDLNIGIISLAQRMIGRDYLMSFIVPSMCLNRVHRIMSEIIKEYSEWDLIPTEIVSF